jgi:hypothetical protein
LGSEDVRLFDEALQALLRAEVVHDVGVFGLQLAINLCERPSAPCSIARCVPSNPSYPWWRARTACAGRHPGVARRPRRPGPRIESGSSIWSRRCKARLETTAARFTPYSVIMRSCCSPRVVSEHAPAAGRVPSSRGIGWPMAGLPPIWSACQPCMRSGWLLSRPCCAAAGRGRPCPPSLSLKGCSSSRGALVCLSTRLVAGSYRATAGWPWASRPCRVLNSLMGLSGSMRKR